MAKKKKSTRKKKPTKKSTRKVSTKKKRATTKRIAGKPPTTGWQRVGRLQLAKLIGVHSDTVTDYTGSGMPVITRGGAGRKSVYDAVECLAWWRAQYRQDKKEAAQTRAYDAQAELNELKIAMQKGELLPREEVVLAGQNYTKAWAAKIRGLPRQMVQLGLIPKGREAAVTAMLHALLLEISLWKTSLKGQ